MNKKLLVGVAFLLGVMGVIIPSGEAVAQFHSADTSANFSIDLSELLRVIQFYNSNGLHCEEGTEDGFSPGPGNQECGPHDSDYNPHDWRIDISELLRMIQMYNARVYGLDSDTEDGFLPIFGPDDPVGAFHDQFNRLRGFIEDQEAGLLLPAVQKLMLDGLEEAELDLLNDHPCGAADKLDGVLDTAQDARPAGGAKSATPEMDLLDFIYANVRSLQFDILVAENETEPCPGRERWGKSGDNTEPEGDTKGMSTRFDFGALKFQSIRLGDGSVRTGLLLPAVQKFSGAPGAPDIPAIRRIFAVPPGASIEIGFNPVIAETIKTNLMPGQIDPLDQEPIFPPYPDEELFADHPFVQNDEIYSSSRAYPPNPCIIQPIGQSRGLELYQVEVFAGQYIPSTGELQLFENMDFDVQFLNGPDGFLPQSAFNPFESRRDVYVGSIINSGIVEKFPPIITLPPELIGEEFMIMTHPNFREAADALAEWKREKGIATNVYECGTGSGIAGRITAAQIKSFIDNHYDTTVIKPTYILLLGDSEFISPFLRDRYSNDPEDDRTIGTDWPYAIRSYPGQEFPTMVPTYAVGRIPVDTLAQANVVVNKIISYEKNPPGTTQEDPFYKNILFAAQFQCCRTDVLLPGNVVLPGLAQRTFTEVSEFIRAPLVASGYNVQRVYRATVDTGCASCDPPRPAYTGDPTPRFYYNGTMLPAAIGPNSGFSWNGTTAQVTEAWNQGRFLIFHRDHGWPGGWGTPAFNSTHADALNNGGFQPVVFSINCSSGLFDNEVFPDEGVTFGGTYFAERLLRNPNGGAVGVIGDTRVSPSWANSAFSRGLFDAIWPNVLPAFGSNTSKRRLGDILNHAKLYMLTQLGATNISINEVLNMQYLYHVIGDPTLEIWTKDPKVYTLSGQISVGSTSRLGILFNYPENDATLTVFQDLGKGPVPIGRATVQDGEAFVEFLNRPEEAPISIVANLDDVLPINFELPFELK
jgi:hypothetical protein